MKASPSHAPASPLRQALRIAGIYCLISGLWIYFSDYFILQVTGDARLLSEIQTIKGWGFVGFSSLLLFFLIRNSLTTTVAAAEKEKQLKEEISTILESVSDGFVALNADWVYTYVNARGAELLGRKREQLLGKTMWEVFPEGIGGSFEPIYRKAMAERSALHMEEYFEPYGIWYENWIYPSQDGISIFFRDITEKKRTEAALLASEEKYRSFFENSIDAFLITKTDGSIHSANPAACDMFGKTELEISTGGRHGITDTTDPNLAEMIATRQREGKVRGKLRMRRADGTLFPAEVTSAIFHSHAEEQLTSMIIRDVSERDMLLHVLRESEQRYRMLFDFNPHPMWVYDVESFKFLLVNQAAIKHYGYSANEFYSMTILDIRPTEDAEKIKELFGLATLEVRYPGTWRHLKKDGTLAWVSITSHLLEEHGKPARLVIAEDVTEKLQVQEKIRQYQEELSALNSYLQSVREDEKKTMAREIHDELGQLLTALKIDLSWVATAHAAGKPVSAKLESALALAETIITKVQRISAELRPGMLDDLGLTPTIEWYLEDFQHRTGITCTASLHEIEGLPPDVALALFRVAQESLTNVARHANAKRVEIQLFRFPDGISLAILDDGSGIPPAKIASSVSLGIIGMRERVRGINGDFTITRLAGGGTKVSVFVPVLESGV